MAEFYARKWQVLEDGGSDRWLYVCRDGGSYVFIEILDLVGYMGRDATAQWCAEVSVVDLANATSEALTEAARSCCSDDRDEWPGFESWNDRLAWACILRDYGHKSPMWSGEAGKPRRDACEDKAFRSLRAAARREAEALLDGDTRELALDTKIVNAIGQTAREYASGTDGLWTALRRIKDDPNATPAQRLVVGMYGACETTLGAGPIPADLRKGDQ